MRTSVKTLQPPFPASFSRRAETGSEKIEAEDEGDQHSSHDDNQMLKLSLRLPAFTDTAKLSCKPGTAATAGLCSGRQA